MNWNNSYNLYLCSRGQSAVEELVHFVLWGAPVQEVQAASLNKGLHRLVKLNPELTLTKKNAKACILEQSAKECVVHQHLWQAWGSREDVGMFGVKAQRVRCYNLSISDLLMDSLIKNDSIACTSFLVWWCKKPPMGQTGINWFKYVKIEMHCGNSTRGDLASVVYKKPFVVITYIIGWLSNPDYLQNIASGTHRSHTAQVSWNVESKKY